MNTFGTPRKLVYLKKILKEMGSTLVAFSGGVDSAFLLKVASDVLKDRVVAVIALSATYPPKEAKAAEEICRRFGLRYTTIETDELNNSDFTSNSIKRCYYCKRELFSKLLEVARENDLNFVSEGSNHDDLKDFRPGMKAIKELGVRSPLLESKLTKDEIRQLSKEMGLSTWDKPSFACLSSRFPYGTTITPEELIKVSRAEEFLAGIGFKQLRVRVHGCVARIEILKEDMPLLLKDGVRDQMVKKMKGLGYSYVTMDLEGYRTGSMNEVLKGLDEWTETRS
ncbi:MAG: ATP-dependent sacrificial sulfur transferase LarE [Candidatus Omnitrophota bacterium]